MGMLRSFDIFDTLIARRCIEPHGIFRAVEQKSGFAGFADLRIEAEHHIYDGDYTLDDIYSQLKSMSGVSDARALQLKNFEINEELNNVIPIQENISKLRDGDILVSDMYLPREVIARLLAKAGCVRETPIIVTSHGKSRGHVWPVLTRHVEIDFHTGDNVHSDIQSAQAHGIEARYTETSKLNASETFLRTIGLPQLCQLVRELRLSQHDDNPVMQNWRRIQCEYNIPLLVLSSLHILGVCKRLERNAIQFSSRDCYFLRRIFDSITRKNPQITSAYFYTSRIARLSRSEDYARYVRQCISEEALIVDLCGTGWSLSAMLENAGVTAPFHLVHDIGDSALTAHYLSIRNINYPHERSFLLRDRGLNNSIFEKFNYVDHGSILDVKYIPQFDQFVPLQEAANYPPEILMCIKATESLVDQFEMISRSCDMDALMSEATALGDQFPDVFRVLYENALGNARFPPAFGTYHADEDAAVFAQLNKSGS